MSKNSESVKKWRKNNKKKMILCMGGCCQICGFDKHYALEFHHVDPSQKDFNLGTVRSNPIAFSKLIPELKKCVLLCSNCHKGVHSEDLFLPLNYKTFDENHPILQKKTIEKNSCPICGKLKSIYNINCSLKCAGLAKRKIDWESIDLESRLLAKESLLSIANSLGCSDNAVRKRAYKIGLIKSNGGWIRTIDGVSPTD